MIDDNRKYTFAILGGDRRQAIVAKRLLDKGHFIKLFGLGTFTADIGCAEICSTCEKAISGSDFVLLPLPATKDKVNLALVSDHTPISLASIVELASKYKCKGILGGILPKEMEHIASVKNVTLYDFYLDESFQKKNALPSAEGALMIAMEHTEKTVKGMNGTYISQEIDFMTESSVFALNVRPYTKKQIRTFIEILLKDNPNIVCSKRLKKVLGIS